MIMVMYFLMLFVFLMFFIFVLLEFSLFSMLIHNILSVILLIFFLVLIKWCKFNSYSIELSKFIMFYTSCEMFSEFLFFLGFLYNESWYFQILLFIKLGMFPFTYYFYLMSGFFFYFYNIKLIVVLYIFFSEIWSALLFSTTPICINLLLGCVTFSTLYLCFNMKSNVLELISSSLVFSNLFIPVMCFSFNLKLVMLYMYIGCVFQFFMLSLMSSGSFNSLDGILSLTCLNGNPVFLFSLVKISSFFLLTNLFGLFKLFLFSLAYCLYLFLSFYMLMSSFSIKFFSVFNFAYSTGLFYFVFLFLTFLTFFMTGNQIFLLLLSNSFYFMDWSSSMWTSGYLNFYTLDYFFIFTHNLLILIGVFFILFSFLYSMQGLDGGKNIFYSSYLMDYDFDCSSSHSMIDIYQYFSFMFPVFSVMFSLYHNFNYSSIDSFKFLDSSNGVLLLTGFQWGWMVSLVFYNFSFYTDFFYGMLGFMDTSYVLFSKLDKFYNMTIFKELFLVNTYNENFLMGCGGCDGGFIPLPLGYIISLVVTSSDVIHSFWVPGLGIKMDGVPGSSNTVVFKMVGGDNMCYDFFCTELCGINHSFMGGCVVPVNEIDLSLFMEGGIISCFFFKMFVFFLVCNLSISYLYYSNLLVIIGKKEFMFGKKSKEMLIVNMIFYMSVFPFYYLFIHTIYNMWVINKCDSKMVGILYILLSLFGGLLGFSFSIAMKVKFSNLFFIFIISNFYVFKFVCLFTMFNMDFDFTFFVICFTCVFVFFVLYFMKEMLNFCKFPFLFLIIYLYLVMEFFIPNIFLMFGSLLFIISNLQMGSLILSSLMSSYLLYLLLSFLILFLVYFFMSFSILSKGECYYFLSFNSFYYYRKSLYKYFFYISSFFSKPILVNFMYILFLITGFMIFFMFWYNTGYAITEFISSVIQDMLEKKSAITQNFPGTVITYTFSKILGYMLTPFFTSMILFFMLLFLLYIIYYIMMELSSNIKDESKSSVCVLVINFVFMFLLFFLFIYNFYYFYTFFIKYFLESNLGSSVPNKIASTNFSCKPVVILNSISVEALVTFMYGLFILITLLFISISSFIKFMVKSWNMFLFIMVVFNLSILSSYFFFNFDIFFEVIKFFTPFVGSLLLKIYYMLLAIYEVVFLFKYNSGSIFSILVLVLTVSVMSTVLFMFFKFFYKLSGKNYSFIEIIFITTLFILLSIIFFKGLLFLFSCLYSYLMDMFSFVSHEKCVSDFEEYNLKYYTGILGTMSYIFKYIFTFLLCSKKLEGVMDKDLDLMVLTFFSSNLSHKMEVPMVLLMAFLILLLGLILFLGCFSFFTFMSFVISYFFKFYKINNKAFHFFMLYTLYFILFIFIFYYFMTYFIAFLINILNIKEDFTFIMNMLIPINMVFKEFMGFKFFIYLLDIFKINNLELNFLSFIYLVVITFWFCMFLFMLVMLIFFNYSYYLILNLKSVKSQFSIYVFKIMLLVSLLLLLLLLILSMFLYLKLGLLVSTFILLLFFIYLFIYFYYIFFKK